MTKSTKFQPGIIEINNPTSHTSPHQGCSLAIDCNGGFYIKGAINGLDEDGDWNGETYFEVTINELEKVNFLVAERAVDYGLSDCMFTTAYGLLIARRGTRQIAYYAQNSRWED
jgi:hypothetical protein